MLENGANVNAKDNNGDTPLHIAASHNASETVVVLLKNAADTSVANDNSHTPLHIAAENKAHETVKALCDHREQKGWFR